MKSALFVTRAQPFHLGHLKVIEWILKRYRKVFIVIGSSEESHTEKNPFTLEERKKMIKNTLRAEKIRDNRYDIIGIPDVYDDKKWVGMILDKAVFDVVFTRNPWTERCFEQLNIEVKKHPLFDDISASEIRRRIKQGKNWEKLVPTEVRRIIKKMNLRERFNDKQKSPST